LLAGDEKLGHISSINWACQLYANMQLLHISARFAYRMFFPQIGIFDGNFNIICVSATYFY